jgi:uncharacterized membrane protein
MFCKVILICVMKCWTANEETSAFVKSCQFDTYRDGARILKFLYVFFFIISIFLKQISYSLPAVNVITIAFLHVSIIIETN